MQGIVYKTNGFKDYIGLAPRSRKFEQPEKGGKGIAVILGDRVTTNKSVHLRFGLFLPNGRSYRGGLLQISGHICPCRKGGNVPLSVLEAGACGIPVIASAVGGISEQIEHGRTGFLLILEHYQTT